MRHRLIIAVIILFISFVPGALASSPAQPIEAMSTFIVNTAASAGDANPGDGVCATSGGQCSLKAAIDEANAHAGADTILVDFTSVRDINNVGQTIELHDTSGGTTIFVDRKVNWTVYRIKFQSDGNRLQGFTSIIAQDGVYIHSNNNVLGIDDNDGDPSNAVQEINAFTTGPIIIYGDNNLVAGNTIGTGVHIRAGADYNVIGVDGDGDLDNYEYNVIRDAHDCGIVVEGLHTVVAGNYIGVDASSIPRPNTRGVCVYGADYVRIGTDGDERSDLMEGNVISGNEEDGIWLDGTAQHNLIAGNHIGTNRAGDTAVPNGGYGIVLSEWSSNNLIGSDGGTIETDEGNVISGNDQGGIYIENEHAGDNVIAGNYIGTDRNGTADLGNGGPGIYVADAEDNTIGDSGSLGNIIAFNDGDGIHIASGGGNNLRGNSIFSNSGLGIDLGADGVTPNDEGDGDSGANGQQNYPLLAFAIKNGSDTEIMGELKSAPNMPYTLDFYVSDSCDPAGYGEGQTWLGSLSLSTGAGGQAGFYHTLSGGTLGQYVTAIATKQDNTSEFSNCVLLAQEPPGGQTFQVNSTADRGDSDTSDGDCDTGFTVGSEAECTLRAAVEQANYDLGADLILLPAGTYNLKAAAGDLDITQDVQIVGAGAATTLIDGSGISDRIFEINPTGASGIQVSISGVTIQDGNLSSGNGAGIRNRGELSLTGVVVRRNSASNGGGIQNYNDGTLTLVDSTVYSNNASFDGGGINSTGLMTITNSTISGNVADSDGGGIYTNGGTMHLASATLTENVADDDNNGGDGGGIVRDSGSTTVTIQNSIIAQNIDRSYGSYEYGIPDCKGDFSSLGYNLLGDRAEDSSSNVACHGFDNNDLEGGHYLFGGAYIAYNAALEPLADNGGSTPTHIPQYRYVAVQTVIDQANPATPGSSATACPTTDQRGQARPTDGDHDGTDQCDRGAVEYIKPIVSIGDATLAEGSSGNFTVNIQPASSYTISVAYVTHDGSALHSSDYVTKTGTLTFPVGSTQQTITVNSQPDSLDEDDETFTVNLFNPKNVTLADAQGTGTITDDDAPPGLSINDVTVNEPTNGTVEAVFSVSLSPASGRQVSVSYTTADDTAIAGSDYWYATGGLVFAPGDTTRSVAITVQSNTVEEGTETFLVNLSSAVNANITDGQGVGTITEGEGRVYLPLVIK
jgi:CSLREA domain-containing protein